MSRGRAQWRALLLAGAAVARFAAASLNAAPPPVDPALPAAAVRADLQGEVIVARSASTQTLVDAWGRAFARFCPRVRLRQTDQVTDLPSRCLAELTEGTVQVAPFVREIQPAERASVREKIGFDPLGLAVASGSWATPSNTHAIAVYVNSANPLARLTLTQLDAVYSTLRRRGAPAAITTWGQLGLGGEWARRPVHFYGMVSHRTVGNPHSGIVGYLMDRVLLGAEFKPETRQVPDTGMGRGNNRALDEIVAAVAGDPDGIGYSGFANALPGAKTVALAEAEGQPYYAGTEADVAQRLYPLTRTIFVFVLRPPGQPLPPALRAFLRFIFSREGQEEVARDPAHFLPLPAAFAAAERSKLD